MSDTDTRPAAPAPPALFPTFLRLTGKRVLVVGAGPVAASKLKALIDAEADIDGADPVLEQAREMQRLAAWRAQASVDDGRGAVGAIDRKLKAPRAAAGKGERLAKFFRKMIEAGDDAFMGDERLGEGKPRRVVWRGKERAARLLAPPKRLIEAMKHGFDRFA